MKERRIFNDKEKQQICEMYLQGYGILQLSIIFKVGTLRIREILEQHSINLTQPGSVAGKNPILEQWENKMFPPHEGFHYQAVLKADTNIAYDDYLNVAGALIAGIKKHLKISTPTLYKRTVYLIEHGEPWHAQFYDFVETPIKPTKKCPYCDWETTDVNNRAGSFLIHLDTVHGISQEQLLKEHPEEKSFFKYANPTIQLQLEEDESKFVTCAICGKKLSRIDCKHLKFHGITKEDYMLKYGFNTISQQLHDKCCATGHYGNKFVKHTKTSKAEREIGQFLQDNSIEYITGDRDILDGKEIDLYIPSMRLGIEYNGLFWHKENMHLRGEGAHKLKHDLAQQKGVTLIQIFEDEFINKKDVVFAKLRSILDLSQTLPIVTGSVCTIKECSEAEGKKFVDKNTLQLPQTMTKYIAAYFDECIVGVLGFRKIDNKGRSWKLAVATTDIKYQCVDVILTLFKYFLEKYDPNTVITIADKRWFCEKEKELYAVLGFVPEKELPPDYTYFRSKLARYKRIPKSKLTTEKLRKSFPDAPDMSLDDMLEGLKIIKIWDSGYKQFKWVKTNEESNKVIRHMTVAERREEFIRLAKEIHKDENLDYSKVNYTNNRTPVCIIDNDLDENGEPYGEYWQIPTRHLRGGSHPRKKGLKITKKQALTQEEVIRRFQEAHKGENMDYSEVEYVNMHTKVKIICHDIGPDGEEYGVFWQEPVVHLKGCTHPRKAIDINSGKQAYTTETFIQKCKELYGEERYSYDKTEYVRSQTKVTIFCNKIGGNGKPHGYFETNPDSFLLGKGCPKCGNHRSDAEDEIFKYAVSIVGEGKVLRNDRSLLGNMELDVYIPEKKFAVEFNGIRWHTEKFGKDKWYHLNKTKACQEKGVVLYQVFEDEYLQHKDLVLDKIGRFLLRGSELPDTVTKVYARNCDVREVSSDEARDFLDKYHLQGYSAATVYLGAFYGDFLVAVMSFKADDKYSVRYELNRFSTDYHYHCVGFGGKLFSHFIENYSPEEVKTFLDRRWCYSEDDNLYTKIGFVKDGILAPEYRYTDGHGERLHKFLFRKQKLAAKYGLDINLTETEMVKKLGYEKIWDCGLIRYRWTRPLV